MRESSRPKAHSYAAERVLEDCVCELYINYLLLVPFRRLIYFFLTMYNYIHYIFKTLTYIFIYLMSVLLLVCEVTGGIDF